VAKQKRNCYKVRNSNKTLVKENSKQFRAKKSKKIKQMCMLSGYEFESRTALSCSLQHFDIFDWKGIRLDHYQGSDHYQSSLSWDLAQAEVTIEKKTHQTTTKSSNTSRSRSTAQLFLLITESHHSGLRDDFLPAGSHSTLFNPPEFSPFFQVNLS